MSDDFGRHEAHLSTRPHEWPGPGLEAAEAEFRILVIGDFSGAEAGAHGSDEPLDVRRPFLVESLDDALERIRPSVDLDPEGDAVLVFESLDDFHPDRIIARLPALRALVDAIDEADDPPLGPSDPPTPGPASAVAPSAPPGRSTEATPGLLDEIVADEEERVTPRESEGVAELRSWIRDIVEPHVEKSPPSGGALGRERAEAEAAAAVRAVMQHPVVHELERAWLSLLHLLRSVAAVPEVRVHLFDLSRADMESLTSEDGPGDSGLLRRAFESVNGAMRDGGVGLVVGGYGFGPSAGDVRLLNRLSIAANLMGASLLTAAMPELLGRRSFEEEWAPGSGSEPSAAWSAFRETEAARSTALLAPGFLVRAPYGEDADPCNALRFEEVEGEGAGAYVWGNPAFLGAAALVDELGREGRGLALGSPHDLSGMPIHTTASGEVGAHPVEVVWSLGVAERILDLGVTPILGYPGEARLRVPAIRSAAPSGALLGHRWARSLA